MNDSTQPTLRAEHVDDSFEDLDAALELKDLHVRPPWVPRTMRRLHARTGFVGLMKAGFFMSVSWPR